MEDIDASLMDKMSNNCSNNVSLEAAPFFDDLARMKTAVLSIIASVSIFGNLITLVSIRLRKRQTRSTFYIFIFQLALADVFVSVFCAAGEAVWTYTVQWLADDVTCKLFKYLQMFGLYLSTYVLVLIGVDRYIAIRYPMNMKKTNRRCNRQIVLVWVLSAIFSIPQMLIFRVQRGPFKEEFYQCVTYGFYTAQWQEQLYTLLTLLLMFILPLIMLLATYIAMFCSISKSVTTFQSKEGESGGGSSVGVSAGSDSSVGIFNRMKRLRTAKNKSLKLTVVIVFAFLVCWTPYYVMMIVFIFLDPGTVVGNQMQSGVFFFGMSNSMLNPLIYGAFHLRRRRNAAYSTRNSNDKSVRTQSRRGGGQCNNVTMVTSTGAERSTWCKPQIRENTLFASSLKNGGETHTGDVTEAKSKVNDLCDENTNQTTV